MTNPPVSNTLQPDQMNLSLEHYLRRWSDLEPARCREVDEMFDVFQDGFWSSIFSLRISNTISSSGLNSLQGALQEALTNRDLSLRLNYSPDNRQWTADLPSVTRAFDEPAIALLQAYVAALESMPITSIA